VVQRLVNKGLLERDRDANDTRRVHLRLRPRGLPFTRRSVGTVEAAVAGALRRAPASQVLHARRLLEEIASALDGSRN
jgi:DNA-binding MarR family transcriptional regulator